MKYVKGDLIKLAKQNVFDVIVHGCNCEANMGAGIALQIAQEFPEAATVDKKMGGSPNRLGSYSAAVIYRYKGLIVVNAYTQVKKGKDARLSAIARVFSRLNNAYQGKKIGICKIGSGLGGLDWNDVEKVIDSYAPDLDITCVEWVKEPRKR